MIPIEDLTDVTLSIEDTDEDDEEDLTDVTLLTMQNVLLKISSIFILCILVY